MTLASLKRRLSRLEQAAGAPAGPCMCQPRRCDMRDYTAPNCTDDPDTDTRPARPCDRCGRPLVILRLVHSKKWPPEGP